jgi:hypothetical protein
MRPHGLKTVPSVGVQTVQRRVEGLMMRAHPLARTADIEGALRVSHNNYLCEGLSCLARA